MFSAVAEDTDDSYADARCAGSVIGVVSPDGKLGSLHRAAAAPKIEGIVAEIHDDQVTLTVVTDADQPSMPSELLSASCVLSQELTRRAES